MSLALANWISRYKKVSPQVAHPAPSNCAATPIDSWDTFQGLSTRNWLEQLNPPHKAIAIEDLSGHSNNAVNKAFP